MNRKMSEMSALSTFRQIGARGGSGGSGGNPTSTHHTPGRRPDPSTQPTGATK